MTYQTSIDGLDFARKSLEIRDTIAVFDFSRLKDVLFSPDGEIQFVLSGGRDTQGHPELELRVSGQLSLVCQRCLGAMAFELNTISRFLLVPDESRLPAPEDEREDVDYIVADTPIDVLTLIEDEMLLGLPLAPAHDDVNCSDALSAAKEQKESPFKVLQGLKLNKE
jgi:uncharacterized protein